MTNTRPRYLSYLLRLWQVRIEGELAWRASLESPGIGERRGFADLESLFAFLVEQVSGSITREEQSNEVG